MRVAVFGASGGIGRLVFDRLLAHGHDVRAIVRRPLQRPPHSSLEERIVRSLDEDTIEPLLRGVQAVISTVGPRSIKDGPVTSTVTAAIAHAMQRTGVRRIVMVSAAPVGAVPPGETRLLRLVLRPLIWRLLGDHYRDLEKAEAILSATNLDWTAIRPPRLSDGPVTGTYRLAVGGSVPGGLIVSRADVASAMCDALAETATFGKPLGIAQ